MDAEMELRLAHGATAASNKVSSRRRRLIDFLKGEADWRLDSLSGLTNKLAEAQGEEIAWIRASQATSIENGRNALLRQLFLGSDDQWSGRGNDVKRSYADGFRGATKTILIAMREGDY